MVRWVKHVDALPDFLSLVYLCAPDRFPKEDFLRDDEQLTLDKAFAEIDRGMNLIQTKVHDETVLAQLRSLRDTSLAAYKAGDRMQGSRALQEFKRILAAKT